MSAINACAACHAAPVPLACSRCLSVKYCNTVCQRADWASHKLVCATLAVRQGCIPGPLRESQLISEEEIVITLVGGVETPGCADTCFAYSRASRGPFATTALLALDVATSRTADVASQMNTLLTSVDGGLRTPLVAEHTIAWRVRAGVLQMVVLIEPRGDLRAKLLRDFVTQTSSAFRAAGAAARVLVLVPLLKLEATMAAPPSGTPERTALAARLERALGASLSAAQPLGPRDLRPFELVGSEAWDPLQSSVLFCDPAGNLLRPAHADPPPMMDARELVAGMGARHCAALRGPARFPARRPSARRPGRQPAGSASAPTASAQASRTCTPRGRASSTASCASSAASRSSPWRCRRRPSGPSPPMHAKFLGEPCAQLEEHRCACVRGR